MCSKYNVKQSHLRKKFFFATKMAKRELGVVPLFMMIPCPTKRSIPLYPFPPPPLPPLQKRNFGRWSWFLLHWTPETNYFPQSMPQTFPPYWPGTAETHTRDLMALGEVFPQGKLFRYVLFQGYYFGISVPPQLPGGRRPSIISDACTAGWVD